MELDTVFLYLLSDGIGFTIAFINSMARFAVFGRQSLVFLTLHALLLWTGGRCVFTEPKPSSSVIYRYLLGLECVSSGQKLVCTCTFHCCYCVGVTMMLSYTYLEPECGVGVGHCIFMLTSVGADNSITVVEKWYWLTMHSLKNSTMI